MPKQLIETNKARIEARLAREGWIVRHGGSHDIYTHPDKPGIITLPRHRHISIGVARITAEAAGWIK